jgi:hypothetical protein
MNPSDSQASPEHSPEGRAADAVPLLHPTLIAEPQEIRRLLADARLRGIALTRGMNRKIEPEVAYIEEIATDSITIASQSFEFDKRNIIFLSFTLNENPYFFQVQFKSQIDRTRVELSVPEVIYRSERRSRLREHVDPAEELVLEQGHRAIQTAYAVDRSPEGLGVEVPRGLASTLRRGEPISVSSRGSSGRLYGEIRSFREASRPGWLRMGLRTSPVPHNSLSVEVLADTADGGSAGKIKNHLQIALASARVVSDRIGRRLRRTAIRQQSQLVDIYDSRRRRLRALIDSWGPSDQCVAVVIPPAWGRTKETLLPLAATIAETFKRAGHPIAIVRYDGINRRGESYKDSECRHPGREQHRFSFSQGVSDLRAVVDYLQADSASRPRKTIVVSFSAASIETRRAVALDSRINGWVSVVGSADLQSMMRSISGGID